MAARGDVVAIGDGRQQQGDLNAQSPAYRNVAAKGGWPDAGNVTTLYESFEASVARVPENKCLGWRPIVGGKAQDYKWWTYKEVQGHAIELASALQSIGVSKGSKIGIYSANTVQWMLVIQAANRLAATIVPLYDSLGESAVEYTVNHSETQLIFAEASKFAPLKKALPKVKDNVKSIIYWGEAQQSQVEELKSEGVNVYAFEEFKAQGKSSNGKVFAPSPKDTACIMYTSGTTGNPKGVVLSHACIMATVRALKVYVEKAQIEVRSDDSLLSYLTMAHILGRMIEEFALFCGAAIGYWQGDVKKLTEDVATLRPTLFVAVPRVLERIQSGIIAKLKKKGWLTRFVFNVAYKWKLGKVRGGAHVHEASPVADKLVFKTFKNAFGGRLRFIVSGGAPLATHVEQFLAVTLCAPVFQGYGLTETGGPSFVAMPKGGHSGTVGPPIAALEVKLEGSEELGYNPLGEPPRGEILVRGPAVFDGYYKDEEKTKESIDSDGWFHSGDVGELTEDGCLKVIDRIKNMFKLAQGEYIAAEKLEQAYVENDLVEQIWIYGNSYESFLVAVVVPDQKNFKSFAESKGGGGSLEELCNNQAVVKAVTEELNKTGKKANLRGFERIKTVHLDPMEWNVDNGLMTPSFKLKRPQLQKHYQKKIDELYKQAKKESS